MSIHILSKLPLFKSIWN